MDKNEKKGCGNCGSKFTYVRIKDSTIVCRSCGYISPIFEEEKKDQEE